MDIENDFEFRPLPEIPSTRQPFPRIQNPLGPLKDLPGTWVGHGFNQIWRPFRVVTKVGQSGPNPPPNQDRFLELNLTNEALKIEHISGAIPNRGLLQPDINMFGVHYLQQIVDRNVVIAGKHAGLHVEPGVWISVPSTLDPKEDPTVVRMASIPHGTTINAQGAAVHVLDQPPKFDAVDITPFTIGNPAAKTPFPETDLNTPTPFRSPPGDIDGITQAMVNNPNSVLTDAIVGQQFVEMEVLTISSLPKAPLTGGGTDNTAFLVGGTTDGPNALAAQVDAIFWIERVRQDGAEFLQLQYSQTVLLNFNGLSWPHVTVATLRKK